MTEFFCPNCNAKIVINNMITDFVHNCSENVDASDAVKEDDIVKIGNWEDYDGSGVISPQVVMRQGLANGMQGTTARGNRASTHRQRAHLEFIDNIKEAERNG